MHHVFGVGVVFAEDEGLWDKCASMEQFGEQRVFESLEHSADLRRDHDGAVEVLRGVGEVFVEPFPAAGACLFAAAVHIKTFLDAAALVGNLRLDPIDFVTDVHAIGDGAFVAVFHDKVLVEETDGLFGRRGGEADEMRVEVFEHLSPKVVDGAMALVGDDEIERLDGDGGVVGDFQRSCSSRGDEALTSRRIDLSLLTSAATGIGGKRRGDLEAGFFVEVFVHFLSTQHGVEALDGADGDTSDRIELVRGQVLDVVQLGELAARVGCDELVELAFGLAPEIGAVHEEQDALRPGVFDEAVCERTGSVGFARTGRHLDKRARQIGGKRLVELHAGFDLTSAHTRRGERMREGHFCEPGAKGVRFGHPRCKCFRPVEKEHAAGTRLGIAFIAEESFDASGFVQERKRPGQPGSQKVRQTGGVTTRLIGDS